MKIRLFKNIWLSLLSVFIVSSVVYGALGWWEGVENAENWEALTHTIWNSLVDGVVKKTGSISETITGVKTFSDAPIVPSTTASWEVASKGYVDSNSSSITSYDSGEQVISANGTLTLPNGLWQSPDMIMIYVRCKVAEYGWSVWDEVLYSEKHSTSGTDSRWFSLSFDSTNIRIKFANYSNVLPLVHKTGSNGVDINNNNWRIIVKAHAF